MSLQRFHWLRRSGSLLLVTLAIVLAGCDPQLRPDGPATTVQPTNRAEALAQQGRHQAAAAEFLRLADGTTGAERQGYLILAAREHARAGAPETAQKLLNRVGRPIAAANQFVWSLVTAEVAVGLGNLEQALASLEAAPAAGDRYAAAELLRLKGEVLFRIGRPVDAVRALVEREIWLETGSAIAQNQRLIWSGFENWGGGLTEQAFANVTDPIVRGWLELGSIAWTRRTNPSGLGSALRAWRQDNRNHPANDSLLPDVLGNLRESRDYPGQVALLLPLGGRQKSAATAVRDGFFAAHFAGGDDAERPAIRIYDATSLGVDQAYQQALYDGADFVVGPLLKKSVQSLASRPLAVPTLALNFLPDDAPLPSNFFQFALSPENEARQIAERALSVGQQRAIMLAPNNAWGTRVATAFRDSFVTAGGQILDYRMYTPDSRDFSASIRQLLLINESEAREERLAANLRTKLAFEPRRRQDVDLIFMAANADAAKLIRPQLRFHYAGTIPAYATSAIYQEGSRNNADLNGIMFPDVTWFVAPDGQAVDLRATLREYWPGTAERRSRLYAMGFDAYNLVPLLYGDSRSLSQGVPGMTGRLFLTPQGRIFRRLPWARMRGGTPAMLDAGITSMNAGDAGPSSGPPPN